MTRQRLTRVGDDPPDDPCEGCGRVTEGEGRYTDDDVYLCRAFIRGVPEGPAMRLVPPAKRTSETNRP